MSIFSDALDKIGGLFGGSEPTVSAGGVPIPQRKPNPPVVISNPAPAQVGGFSLGKLGDFLNSAGKTVGGVAETFFKTKSQIEQLKTAQELEKIKLRSVTESAQNAPAPAQVILPTVADFINDPREAVSRVTPAALAGSGAFNAGISSLALVAGGGVLLYVLAKR